MSSNILQGILDTKPLMDASGDYNEVAKWFNFTAFLHDDSFQHDLSEPADSTPHSFQPSVLAQKAFLSPWQIRVSSMQAARRVKYKIFTIVNQKNLLVLIVFGRHLKC